ncbi:MAG: hypothetical protein AB8C84_08890 [Oligoflexales bacterium]
MRLGPVFLIIFFQSTLLQAAAFSLDVWEYIPHQCLRDILTGSPIQEYCQKPISNFLKKENRQAPLSFNNTDHTPFNLYCKCGVCDLKFYIHALLHHETLLLKRYIQSELWRKELILDGTISDLEKQDIKNMIIRIFHSNTTPQKSSTLHPLEYWENLLLLSQQEPWIARLGFLETDDPQLQLIHPNDQKSVIQATRIIRSKIIASTKFSRFWSEILSGSSQNLTPEEVHFHRSFKENTENHYFRQNKQAANLKQKHIEKLLYAAAEGSKNPHIAEALCFLKSESFQKDTQNIIEISTNLKSAFSIQKFCYFWVKTVRRISRTLVQKHDADTITPLSVLLMIFIDQPHLLSTLSTLEKLHSSPFYDGWDYYLTLLYCSSEASIEIFSEIENSLKTPYYQNTKEKI